VQVLEQFIIYSNGVTLGRYLPVTFGLLGFLFPFLDLFHTFPLIFEII
jgi:hypothetical protein